MNYLAHIYLSGNNDGIRIGNFIGDYVKGNRYLEYPDQVALGIKMHRAIDAFTDAHPLVKESNKLLQPGMGRYAGIVTDIFFDHFLAANFNDYSNQSLRHFAREAHSLFLSHFMMLPLRVKQFLPFLIQHRRFESYAATENLVSVLEIMSKRTSLPANGQWAVDTLHAHYTEFESHFKSFFEEMILFAETEYKVYIDKPKAIVLYD
ncbi:MAG: ACP phosphodiesterase [Marinilabiliales bacterium]|nr:ACP phosphodiesterase [Marinilabiliales bacterium]